MKEDEDDADDEDDKEDDGGGDNVNHEARLRGTRQRREAGTADVVDL